MKLDVRIPIGLMFAVVGLLLVIYGIVADRAIYARSLGVNVNLWWGLVLLVFGLVMLGFAWASWARGGSTKESVGGRPE
jgi:uncharacterized membrane protein